MDELIDIVNEWDQIIGQELKSRCHKEKILHRGSGIFVFKDNTYKEILLQRRSMQKESNPGDLCIPGGHLQVGETYIEGAKREYFEEMYNSKYSKGKIQFEELFKIKKFADNDHEFITLFRTIDSGPFKPDLSEVESYRFENIDQIFKKIKAKPKNYTQTLILLLKECKERIITY